MNGIHTEPELFADLILATSDALAIPAQLIEKDYYISMVLRSLSESTYAPQIVFKGGTSLSKAYHLINRFSEDVDFAVLSNQMSGNQVKRLLSHLMKEITVGLVEDTGFPDISKGSKYRKQAFLYDGQIRLDTNTNPIPTRIIVEISAFANPFPNEKRMIEPFVTAFLREQAMSDFIAQYHLEPFELNVLSPKQTLCEKTISLIRFSMSDNPLHALSAKIRHFYDLDALLSMGELQEYVCSEAFAKDVEALVRHDRDAFDEPKGWSELEDLSKSPLMSGFDTLWTPLSSVYESNLSLIAYRPIPSSEAIKSSFMMLLQALKNVHVER